jgi:phenylacetate-coenzyme A ligase PaaK-like adenylate-forming protein
MPVSKRGKNSASEFYDDLETRDPLARETALMAALPVQIAHAKARASHFTRLLADVEADAVTSRAALAQLPVTRKSDLPELQQAAPPLGGLAAIQPGTAARLFASPGPLYEPEGPGPDYWRTARALFAAGFRSGDIVHNSFSYHLTPGGWIMDMGLRALGCAVVPAGTGNSEAQAQAIAQYRPAGYAGTPDYLLVLLDAAAKLDLDCSSIVKGMVSGGALFPSLRQDYAARGISILQCYATAELGLIAYESRPDGGLIVDEHLIVEIVRPGTGDPVPGGEVGEVVVTTLNPDYPLIRFATGDLSALAPGISPCGRTNTLLRGWLGRADQTTKVKGMFIQPGQIADVLRRHPALARGRLIVSRDGETDAMALHCEVAGDSRDETLVTAVADTLRAICKIKGRVILEPPGTLPNDGKVIEDTRTYE